MSSHTYDLTIEWTGAGDSGTTGYRAYGRDHTVRADGPPDLLASADRTFRGDPDRWNPEQLMVAALSECHLLAYLHACVEAGVVVVGYVDRPTGTMEVHGDGSGEFTDVLLRPEVVVATGSDTVRAKELHDRAHELCFIAQSVAFQVRHEPTIRESDPR